MHSAKTKDGTSSLRGRAVGKFGGQEHNNNNELFSPAQAPMKQNTRDDLETGSANFWSSRNGSSSTTNKIGITKARIGASTNGKFSATGTAIKQNPENTQSTVIPERADTSKPSTASMKSQTSTCQPERSATGRRISSGAEIMSRFAPRPYRATGTDATASRIRSQSVEVHLSGSRSVDLGPDSQRNRIHSVEDKHHIPGQRFPVKNSSSIGPTAVVGRKTNSVSGAHGFSGSGVKSPVYTATSNIVTSSHAESKLSTVQQSGNIPQGTQSSLLQTVTEKSEKSTQSNTKVIASQDNLSNDIAVCKSMATVTNSPELPAVTCVPVCSNCTINCVQPKTVPPPSVSLVPTVAPSLQTKKSVLLTASGQKEQSNISTTRKLETISSKPPLPNVSSAGQTTSAPIMTWVNLADAMQTTTVHVPRTCSSKEPAKTKDIALGSLTRESGESQNLSGGALTLSDDIVGLSPPVTASGAVKHRAVIKSCPETLLYGNSSPLSSQLHKSGTVLDLVDNNKSLNKLVAGNPETGICSHPNTGVALDDFTSSPHLTSQVPCSSALSGSVFNASSNSAKSEVSSLFSSSSGSVLSSSTTSAKSQVACSSINSSSSSTKSQIAASPFSSPVSVNSSASSTKLKVVSSSSFGSLVNTCSASANSRILSSPSLLKKHDTNSSIIPSSSTSPASGQCNLNSLVSSSTASLPCTAYLTSSLDSMVASTSSSRSTTDSPISLSDSPTSPTDSLIMTDSPMNSPSDLSMQAGQSSRLRLSVKIDTSNDSVNSALSVLMKRQSASGSMVPASPKCSYRYGSRGAISSIYQNKLGSSASNQYNKNMDELYGNFFVNMKDCRSVMKDSTSATSPTKLQQDQVSTEKMPQSPTPRQSSSLLQEASAKQNSNPGTPGSPVLQNLVDPISLNLYICPTDRRSLCNAPQPVRRVLSGEIASKYTGYSPVPSSESRRLFFEGSSAVKQPDGTTINGVDRSPSPVGPYDPPLDVSASFIDDCPSDDFRETVVVDLPSTSQRRNRRERHVRFEPVSLLLSAALEGELDLIKATIPKVRDAMVANDSGITALHNAVYSGHYEVCQFLIEYGCKVNATDIEGWTPLHCAASCNNLELMKLLVQNGASIFSMTFTDREIPMQKCNKQLPGYDVCFRYLCEQGQVIGIVNDGTVYATNSYDASSMDELSFKETDQLQVIRKGDETEVEWWWAKLAVKTFKQGYVPRNFMAMYPARPKLK